MKTEDANVNSLYPRLDPGANGLHVEGFLCHLRDLNYLPLTISYYSGSARHFAEWLNRSGIALADITDDVVQQFAVHQCQCPGGKRNRRRTVRYVSRVRQFVSFLASLGLTPAAPKPPPLVIDERVVEFQNWLRCHRGFKESTIKWHGQMLMLMLPVLGDDPANYTSALIRKAFRNVSTIMRQLVWQFKLVRSPSPPGHHRHLPNQPALRQCLGHAPVRLVRGPPVESGDDQRPRWWSWGAMVWAG